MGHPQELLLVLIMTPASQLLLLGNIILVTSIMTSASEEPVANVLSVLILTSPAQEPLKPPLMVLEPAQMDLLKSQQSELIVQELQLRVQPLEIRLVKETTLR